MYRPHARLVHWTIESSGTFGKYVVTVEQLLQKAPWKFVTDPIVTLKDLFPFSICVDFWAGPVLSAWLPVSAFVVSYQEKKYIVKYQASR